MGNSAQAVTDEQGEKVEPSVTFQTKVNEATEQLTREFADRISVIAGLIISIVGVAISAFTLID